MIPADPREALLRRLTREARAEQTAELDWARMEERLVRHAERAKPAAPRPLFPLAWAVGLTAAVGAAAALWLVTSQASVNPRPAVADLAHAPRQDARALPLGKRLEAGAKSVVIDHAGRASWTLEPGSAASMIENLDRITVRLERGSLLARVVPNPRPETFVVEAAGARVAVHGTVFRVALVGARVAVEVTEGTVGVGSLGAPARFLLEAPTHAEFATDGSSGSRDGIPLAFMAAPTASQPKHAAPHLTPTAPAGSATLPGVTTPLPLEPTISDIEAGVAPIVDVASSCFAQHTRGADGVQITVRTALTLTIDASGTVSDVHFQPPLSPEVEACAAASISGVTFTASEHGAKVTRMLELKR